MFILFTDLLSLSGLTSYTLLSTLILEEMVWMPELCLL